MKVFAIAAMTCYSLTTACGAAHPEADKTAALSASSIGVQVAYRYEPAKPVTVNGASVLAHKYWSCVDSVALTFPEPMRLATVLGGIDLEGQYNMHLGVTPRTLVDGYQQVVLEAGAQSLCNDAAPPDRVTIASAVRSVAGSELAAEDDVALAFPPSRDDLPADARRSLALPSADMAPAPEVNTALSPSQFTVTPESLNAAIAAMHAWIPGESANALYADATLKLMPLDFLLGPYASPNRRNQYGAPDTLYALRRAAHFTQLLFPALTTIPVADLSAPDGSTPTAGPIPLHPPGSHTNGTDVDVAYITIGSGNDAGAPFDYEKNFWFLYGLLDSTGVDMVLTAYQATFVSLAQQAYQEGLINAHAVGRFGALIQDTSENHGLHMHIAVSNLLNNGQSRKFTPADDVYSCYLGLDATHGGDGAANDCDNL